MEIIPDENLSVSNVNKSSLVESTVKVEEVEGESVKIEEEGVTDNVILSCQSLVIVFKAVGFVIFCFSANEFLEFLIKTGLV